MDDHLILKTHRETNGHGRAGELTLHMPDGKPVRGAIKVEYVSEPGVETRVMVTFLPEFLRPAIGELDPAELDYDCGCT